MCGIAGRAGPSGRWAADRAISALAHRGPDASGVDSVTVGPWACDIAHTRLAINDLTPAGDQPLHNEDGTLALTFNGEIYNSPELRRECEAKGHVFRSESDAEVIVHLWEDEGAESLTKLNGIFALALLDRRDGSVVLARDPMGVKPLFWTVDHDTLWFASELRALEAAGANLGGPDVVALAQFLTLLWIPDPRTPYERVSSLPPGWMLRWQQGAHTLRRFSDPIAESAAAEPVSMATARSEFRDRFRGAVQRQLLSDVPIGVMVSGGIDSSLLWWAAGDSIDAAYTIDWSAESGDEGLHEDTAAVRQLAEAYGTGVHYLPGAATDIGALPTSGDLFADPAVELCRQIAEQAHEQGHKVLLSGQGGDELFGGYRRHILGPTAARLPAGALGRATAAALARTTSSVRAEYVARLARSAAERDPLSAYLVLCSYSDAAERAAALDVTTAEVADGLVFASHREAHERTPRQWSLLRRFRAVDLAVYLPGLGLAYADRSGMAHSVEIRVPWLDLDLVRWALRLPDEALVHRGTGKVLARELAREVLPAGIADRPKRGFAVPARLLPPAPAGQGRGFRQARYLSSAVEIVDRWKATTAARPPG